MQYRRPERCLRCRPTIEELRQHPWVNRDYQIAQPREPMPTAGTGVDLFEPTVKPQNLSLVSPDAALPVWWRPWHGCISSGE